MRAKFKCVSVNDFGFHKEIELSTAYSDNPEDNQFSEATPNGNLKMTVTHKGAMNFLKPGKSYYLDFTEEEK